MILTSYRKIYTKARCKELLFTQSIETYKMDCFPILEISTNIESQIKNPHYTIVTVGK